MIGGRFKGTPTPVPTVANARRSFRINAWALRAGSARSSNGFRRTMKKALFEEAMVLMKS